MIAAYITYKITESFFNRIVYYVNLQYLDSLQKQLKEARLSYERGKMSKEEYRKLEATLTRTIKSFKGQLHAPQRVLDIRL